MLYFIILFLSSTCEEHASMFLLSFSKEKRLLHLPYGNKNSQGESSFVCAVNFCVNPKLMTNARALVFVFHSCSVTDGT